MVQWIPRFQNYSTFKKRNGLLCNFLERKISNYLTRIFFLFFLILLPFSYQNLKSTMTTTASKPSIENLFNRKIPNSLSSITNSVRGVYYDIPKNIPINRPRGIFFFLLKNPSTFALCVTTFGILNSKYSQLL